MGAEPSRPIAAPATKPCWRSDNQFEGPWISDKHFMICVAFDDGTHKNFSGIRVVIYCAGGEGLLSLNLQECPIPLFAKGSPSTLVQKGPDDLEAHQRPSSASSLPLYTLWFEIVDKSDAEFEEIRLSLLPADFDMESLEVPMRKIYDYTELSCASLVLLLSSTHTFRRTPKPYLQYGFHPIPVGVVTHSVRILPEDLTCRPFSTIPTEILLEIFSHVATKKYTTIWRKDLVSSALVCRAWRPALYFLFESLGEFARGEIPPDIKAMAWAIKRNPGFGRAVREFSPKHFFNSCITSLRNPPWAYEDVEAAVTILKGATLLGTIQISSTEMRLKNQFLKAIRTSTAIWDVHVDPDLPFFGYKDRYTLSADDILRCACHWPRLKILTVMSFQSYDASNQKSYDRNSSALQLPPPTCRIQQISFYNGTITTAQLSRLTFSSLTSIESICLNRVNGLTNKGLKHWLSDVGPNLRRFMMENCGITREANEEYAMDACIASMVNMESMNLKGDVASKNVFLRKKPLPHSRKYSLKTFVAVIDAPAISARRLVGALKTTGWENIHICGPNPEYAEVKDEIEKAAKQRKIEFYWMSADLKRDTRNSSRY